MSLIVALLTESVDWNINSKSNIYVINVALLTESVDWNLTILFLSLIMTRRSPHGERGLK